MRRIGAVLAVLVASVLLTPSAAYSCSCVPGVPAEQLARADKVFIGTVDGVHTPPQWLAQAEFGTQTFARLAVERAIKGVVRRHTLIGSSGSGASCGIGFQASKRYIVYANERSGYLWAGLCNGTHIIDAAAAAPAPLAGAAIIPGADRQRLWWLPWALAGLIAAIIGAIVLFRRRRRRLAG